jgi:hypothetical protein
MLELRANIFNEVFAVKQAFFCAKIASIKASKRKL